MNMPAQFLNQIDVNPKQGKSKQLTFMKNSPKALSRWMPRLLPLAAALALAACSTQPVYQPPRLEVPAQFKEATPEAAQFGIWQPAQSSAASPAAAVPDPWWTVYGDSMLDQLQQAAAAANPSVEQAVARLRSAQAAVASSRAAQWPTLGTTGSGSRALTGGGTYSNTNGENVARSGSINNNFSMGLSASWEVDLWGKLSGAVDANKATAQATSDDLAAARLSAQASVTQTYFSLRAAEAQMQFLQETLSNYEQSLKLTQNRYQAGVASSADVAQAQSQYKSTQASLIEAQTTRA